VADHGYDDHPFPGYQNTLVLSTPDGRWVDATGNLPQQDDFTHSATAADIDGDADTDLYYGNFDAQNEVNPQILLNDSGRFTVGSNRLPSLVGLDRNHYSGCQFSDVNNDGSPDLILGAASGSESVVLRNDGRGVFTPIPGSMPPKDALVDRAHDIEPSDINRDGYVDLFIEYERPEDISYIQVLINEADGTFRDKTATRLEPFDRPVSAPVLELRDLNRDGALDLLAMPWDPDNPDPILFLNDGHGRFRREPFDVGLSGGHLCFAFIDLEGNGGHDVLLTLNYPPDYVFAIRDLGCRVAASTIH
jgi:hypothetical protein